VCVVSVRVAVCLYVCVCDCARLSGTVCLFADTGVLAAIDINTLILDGFFCLGCLSFCYLLTVSRWQALAAYKNFSNGRCTS